MKNLFITTLLLFSLCLQAQSKGMFSRDPIINLENFDKQRVHWGYFLGFNMYDFKIDYIQPQEVDVAVKTITGFNVGLVGNLRIHEYIDLRFEPGLYYCQRDLTYPDFTRDIDRLRQVKSTYIHFPLLVKFSSKRIGNLKPYLVGGVSRTLNLASNFKSEDDNLEQRFRVNQWTSNYELGFGIDFYLEYFKFSPSIRGVFGLGDELIRDKDPFSPWTGNISSLSTRAVLVNFTFH